MAATVTLSIYEIRSGGQHGTSFGSDIPVKLAAGEKQDWIGQRGFARRCRGRDADICL
jgi:hypothetical protein